MNNDIIKIFIWVGVIGAVFGFLWWKGYLIGLRNYWNETVQELKDQGYTLTDIGEMMGISPQRAQQLAQESL